MSSLDNSSLEDGSLSLGGSSTEQDWTTVDPTLEQSSVTDVDGKQEGMDVSVALPPSLSAKRSMNEVALTGSAALDVLDQVSSDESRQIGFDC